MPIQSVNLISRIVILARKDLIAEFRSRYALNAILMFALITLTVVSFAIGLSNPSVPPSLG